MSAKLFLGLRLNSQYQKVALNDVNLNDNVKTLKALAAETASSEPDELELTFCGNILKDNETLTESGLRTGVTVHVLKKKPTAPTRKKASLSASDIVSAFKTAIRHPNYRSAFLKLSQPDALENLIAATPGLEDDQLALAMLQDPHLMMFFYEPSTVTRAIEEHPALVEAAQYILTVIHDEASSPASASAPSTGYQYTLEYLSDDEDMESSQSSDSQAPSANSSINTSQLAAALAAANAALLGASPSSNEPAGVITPEMVGAAIGQAFASSNSQQSTPSTTPAADNWRFHDMEGPSRRVAQHMQQMRELGLRDETVNLQALMATDWNVQEAINLVFSGAMNDLEPEAE